MAKTTVKTKKRIPFTKIIYVSAMVLVIAFGSFFFVRYIQVNNKYNDAILTQDQRNQQTLDKISKLMALPKGEKPTDIIVIKDKEKLNTPATTKVFYADVKNGDILVAYQKANQAIIYRPNENRIIKTDNYNNFYAATYPVNLAIIAPESAQSETEKLITQKVLNINVVSKRAPKGNISQSVVVDLTGTNAKAAKELADKLGIPVGQLPADETKPEGATLAVIMANSPTQPAATP